MKVVRMLALTGLLVATTAAGADRPAARTGMCMVCAVTHGEAEPEPVKAVRVHDGTEYGFCSEKCAKAFAEDPAAYLPPSFPRQAPAFALTDLSGRPVSNESLKGRAVLLDFWATWCAPCRKSMPELEALHQRYRDKGVTVLGVSIDEGSPKKVRGFVKARRLTYPIAIDTDRTPAWAAYKVKAVPAAFLIDRDGRIVAQWTGQPATPQAVEAKLHELLPRD